MFKIKYERSGSDVEFGQQPRKTLIFLYLSLLKISFSVIDIFSVPLPHFCSFGPSEEPSALFLSLQTRLIVLGEVILFGWSSFADGSVVA